MTDKSILLVANGEIAFLWLGAAVSPQILNDLYGVENLDEIDTRIVRLCSPNDGNPYFALTTISCCRRRYRGSRPTYRRRSETSSPTMPG